MECARSLLQGWFPNIVRVAAANFLSDVTMSSVKICTLINRAKIVSSEERDFMEHSTFYSPFQMKRKAYRHSIFPQQEAET